MLYEGTGVGSPFIFFAARFLVLLVLCIAGYGISYGKPENFKKYAWFAGIVYSLVEGLRWLRGADYCHYYNDIVTNLGENPMNLYGERIITPEPELIYQLWINFFNFTTLPFWVAFIFYSALLIGGLLLVVKQFPKSAVIALPLFFVLTVDSSENLIRQYFAEALMFYAYYFHLKEKRAWMVAMLIIAPLIHYSAIAVDIIFLAIVLTWKPLEKFYRSYATLGVLFAIFLYGYFVFDISNFQFIADFAYENVDLGDDKAALYVDGADQWLSEEGSLAETQLGISVGAISIYNNIVKFIAYSVIIIIGFLLVRADKRLAVAYAFSYIAILLKTTCSDIELYLRLYYWFVILLPIIAGCVFNKDNLKPIWRALILGVFILCFLWYGFLRSGFSATLFGYGFIWDANVNIW